jgi:P pilus assembly chaperone PapD
MFSTACLPRKLMLGVCLALATSSAFASGLVPETTVLLINEADGEGVVSVKNTDPGALLLYTTVQHIPEDKENLFIITPPVARVEPEQKQLVRFILTNTKPLTVQRLQRVIFEGIPQTRPGENTVHVNIRHNIPAVIHPKALKMDPEPWKRLVWSAGAEPGSLQVANPSPYVVRLGQEVQLQPAGTMAKLPKPYVLPGETIALTQEKPEKQLPKSVVISPATVYGIYVDTYEAPLVEAGAGAQAAASPAAPASPAAISSPPVTPPAAT